MNTAMLHLLLEHPERFAASEVPCCLLGLWELAMDELAQSCEKAIDLPKTVNPVHLDAVVFTE